MCIYINIYALEREESLYVYVGTERDNTALQDAQWK